MSRVYYLLNLLKTSKKHKKKMRYMQPSKQKIFKYIYVASRRMQPQFSYVGTKWWTNWYSFYILSRNIRHIFICLKSHVSSLYNKFICMANVWENTFKRMFIFPNTCWVSCRWNDLHAMRWTQCAGKYVCCWWFLPFEKWNYYLFGCSSYVCKVNILNICVL